MVEDFYGMVTHLCGNWEDEKSAGDKEQPRESVKENPKSTCERMRSDVRPVAFQICFTVAVVRNIPYLNPPHIHAKVKQVSCEILTFARLLHQRTRISYTLSFTGGGPTTFI